MDTRFPRPTRRAVTTEFRLAALLVAGLLPLLCPGAERIRTLIITGIDYPGHHWWETTPVLQEELGKDPRMEVEVFKDPHQLGNKRLADYDVLILHFMNWEKPDPGPEARENLRRFVDQGGGLVGLHFACGAFSNWNEYPNLLGRTWDHTNTHDPRGVFTVSLQSSSHPITTGLPKTFETDDELYTCLTGTKPVEIIAKARSKVTKQDHPMGYAHQYGAGRVFFTPLGHDAKALRAPGTAELIRRAVAWTAGRPATAGNAPAIVPGEAINQTMQEGVRLMHAGSLPEARRKFQSVTQANDAAPAHRAIAHLLMAQSYEQERRWPEAKEHYGKAEATPGALSHHKEEAARRKAELERVQNGLPARDAMASRTSPIFPPKPGKEIHVAPHGDDSNPGTENQPLASLEKARNRIRDLKKQTGLPPGGVSVVLHEGSYPIRGTFTLEAQDSGIANAPVIYRAAPGAKPRFTGGVPLTGFEPVQDPAILNRLPAPARGKVQQVSLRKLGVTNLWPVQLGGFASGRGFRTHPAMELFINGRAMTLARWPNEGFVRVANVGTNESHQIHGLKGTKEGRFIYEGDRPERWKGEPNALLYGYWFWDWADSYERIAEIDPARKEIRLATPFHTYGYRKGQPYHALNLLCELDQPGEWYLEASTGMLYAWFEREPSQSTVMLSTAPVTFIELRNASHVVLEGFTFEFGSADALRVSGGEQVLMAGCTIRHFAGDGVIIQGGRGHGIHSCDIHSLGRGGLSVSGGDRRTLTPANHVVENCHIHDLSRIDHTYTPAIIVSGVGQRVAHNLMHNIRSSALRVGGNDHLIELNEIGHVVQESDDQGGVDMHGDASYRGIVYRWNYFHHIGPWTEARMEPALGQAGIRLDDAISGMLIYGNIFRRASTGKLGFGGVQIHGGKENIVDNNLFVDCVTAISFSPWSESHWREFTKGFPNAREIDLALYTNRYPALARFNEDLNVNEVWRNQGVRCDRFLHRNRSARLFANYSTQDETALVAALTTFPAPDSDALGLAGIPFAEVGLYRNQWRPTWPATLVQQLRSDLPTNRPPNEPASDRTKP